MRKKKDKKANSNGSGSGNNPNEQAQIQNACDFHAGNPNMSATQDDEHATECTSCHW